MRRLVYWTGYQTERLFDNRDMPLDISIGDQLVIGGIVIGTLLLAYSL